MTVNEDFNSLKRRKVLREITDTFCKYAGFTPHVVFESDDPANEINIIL